MIINSINVKNFRSIYDETLPLENLTALIGPNGSGKSSFLKAIDLFYNSNGDYTEKDFYSEDLDKNIEITITFNQLTDDERILFKNYVKDNKLVITKIIKWPKKSGSQLYYGEHLQNRDFDSFRKARGSDLRKEYNNLKDNKYPDFPTYTNKINAESVLEEWENSNPEDCILRQDEGQFFGFKEVGTSRLEQFTRFIYIPAVHDASDESSEGGKKSVLTEIMDMVVRNVLSQKKEFIELETKTQQKYDDVIENESSSLKFLEKDISRILRIYAPNAAIDIEWEPENIKLPTPNASIELVEDGYRSSVERCGHGLQRAFIMSMFQYLTTIQSISKVEEKTSSKLPTLIIGIEEPEIYQHPNRQRYLSKILSKLAEGNIKGVAEKIQIVYTTHSPLFVDLENFNKIRKLDKVDMDMATEDRISEKKPKITRINYTNFEEVVEIIEKAENVEKGTYKPEGFEGRIKAIMTPWMNEGFFADVVVLVEGVDDRAAILGLANGISEELEDDFEGKGISIIPCMGKTNLHQPYAIFSKLNIPVYCIWDSDHKKYKEKPIDKQKEEIDKNHRLLRICGCDVEDWPDTVSANFACFKNDLNDSLRNGVGKSNYDEIIENCCNHLDMKKKDAIKRPRVIEHLITESRKKGSSPETLEKIICKIQEMRDN